RLSSAPPSTLFPYTTLFRSDFDVGVVEGERRSQRVSQRVELGDGSLRVIYEIAGEQGNSIVKDAEAAAENRTASGARREHEAGADRKSTRLNSSHDQISYAV